VSHSDHRFARLKSDLKERDIERKAGHNLLPSDSSAIAITTQVGTTALN